MPTPTILLIAVGLSMDAFAVAISFGLGMRVLHLRYALRIALFFGVFQAIMPIIGYLAGLSIRGFLENFDHWIAFALLFFIGSKMIYEAFALEDDQKPMNPQDLLLLFTLAFATSIDALAVGLSLSFLKVDILQPAIIIGVTTLAISFAGVFIGQRLGHLFEKKIEIAGGLILIGIGLKILCEHLF